MRSFIITLVFLAISLANTYAQSVFFEISGTVQLQEKATVVEAATIYLESVKDSTVISYTISNEKGKFFLEGKSFYKKVNLYIAFTGLETYKKQLTLTGKPNNLRVVQLREATENLGEVVIKSKAPIVVKKDTLEFNVKSFKTKKNANVEDLLKKLPGVEVDETGKITVNGKPVNKILVNGKPFFGNDPTITTKNLTKDIIEKVQITDTKTKAEAFAGEKGDKDNKTINLTIKEENNKGWFGRLAAGAGTNKRYEGAAILNRFNNKQRFSILLGGNNINSPGFSFGEIQKMFGGGGSMWVSSGGSFGINGRNFGGGKGIVKSKTAGATYANDLRKGLEVNADYFYSSSNSDDVSKNNRENILPTGSYFSSAQNNFNSKNQNHNLNMEFDIEVDSTFLINISPSIVINKRKQIAESKQQTLNSDKVLTNASNSLNNSESTANNFKNRIELTKKMGNKGAFVKMSVTNQVDKSETESRQISKLEVFGNTAEEENRNQSIDADLTYKSLFSKVTYRHPLIAKTFFLDVKYSYRSDKRKNVRSTYDHDENTYKYQNFNPLLSTNFTYNNIRATPEINFVYNKKKWSASVGMGYVFRTLKNKDELRPVLNLTRKFKAFEMQSRLNYRFNSKTSVFLSYSRSDSPPDLSQLQPFEDQNNPLNVVVGNPNLKPTQRHRLYFGFNKFNWQKGTGFYMYASGNLNKNVILPKSVIDPITLKRKTTYENVENTYNAYLSASYSKKIKLDTLRTIKLRVGAYGNNYRTTNFFNNAKYKANTFYFSPNVGFTFDWRNMLQIEPRYTVSLSKTNYDIANLNTKKFTRHSLAIRTKTTVPKRLEWSNDVSYNYNPDVIGFQKSAWFWNSTLAYSLKNNATLTLKVYDLLNQNTNAKRRVTENYIEDVQSTVLQRYFMLSFSWKFNSLGKKGEVGDVNFFF